MGYFFASAPPPPTSANEALVASESEESMRHPDNRRPASVPFAAGNNPSYPYSSATNLSHLETPFTGSESGFFYSSSAKDPKQRAVNPSSASWPAAATSSARSTPQGQAPYTASSYGHPFSLPAEGDTESTTAEASATATATTTDTATATVTDTLVWDQSNWNQGVWAP